MFTNSGLLAGWGNIAGELIEDGTQAISWVANIPSFIISAL